MPGEPGDGKVDLPMGERPGDAPSGEQPGGSGHMADDRASMPMTSDAAADAAAELPRTGAEGSGALPLALALLALGLLLVVGARRVHAMR